MADVFVSYSRRDSAFVHLLVAELEARGKSVWIDVDGIEVGEVFPEAIRTAIAGADVFLFVITSASAASAYCEQEVEHALALNKRVVPVLREPVADAALPEAIRVRNWIHYAVDDDQKNAAEQLSQALDVDVEHTRAHTRWLVKALDWEGHGHDRSFLLRGSELASAETWLAGVGDDADPAPTTLQREYLLAGRRASARRQRIVVGASLTAVVVAVALAVAALLSRDQAQKAGATAQSRALAAESVAQLSVDPERSILLAVAADKARRTPEATYALRRALDLSPIRQRLPSVGDQSTGGGFGPNVAFSPDATQIAEGSWNGTVQLVDAGTMKVARRVSVGTHAPWVAYSPDGSVLAVATDGSVVLLDPMSGERRGTIDAMTGVQGLQFSPDGRQLAAIAANADGTGSELVIRDTQARTSKVVPLGRVGSQLGTNYAFSVGFSPEGRRIVVGAVNGIGVFDARTGRLLSSALTGEQTTHAEYSPDGSLIAVTRKSPPSAATKTFRAELIDAHTLRRRVTIYRTSDPQEPVRWTAFSPDGKRVAFVAGDVFGIYSLAVHRLLYETTVSAPYLAGAEFSPDGHRFAVVAGDGSGVVYSADGAEQLVIDAGPINPTVIGSPLALGGDRVVAAFSPLTGENTGREVVQAWSLNGSPIGEPLVVGDNSCQALLVASQARFAYTGHARRDCTVEGGPERVVRVWDLGLRRPVRSLNPSTAGNPNPPSLNGDGSRMAEQLDTGQGSIDLLSVETGATTFVGASDCLFSAQAISDDGAIVAALDQCPNRLTTWALTPVGTHARQLPLAGATATGPLRFSPDAKQLAIGNVNGRGGIAIVDATGGQIIATLVGHATRIVDVAYSPDGRLLVTASRDGTARVWNPSTGRLLRTLDHPHPVFGVAFSPDSRTIATFDEGGIIRLWDACTDCENPDALLALARKRVTRGLTPAERRSYGG